MYEFVRNFVLGVAILFLIPTFLKVANTVGDHFRCLLDKCWSCYSVISCNLQNNL